MRGIARWPMPSTCRCSRRSKRDVTVVRVLLGSRHIDPQCRSVTRGFRAGETVEGYCRACKSIASTRSSSSAASAARSPCPATTAKVSTTSGADAAGTNAVDAELEHLESEARFGDEAVRVAYPYGFVGASRWRSATIDGSETSAANCCGGRCLRSLSETPG